MTTKRIPASDSAANEENINRITWFSRIRRGALSFQIKSIPRFAFLIDRWPSPDRRQEVRDEGQCTLAATETRAQWLDRLEREREARATGQAPTQSTVLGLRAEERY